MEREGVIAYFKLFSLYLNYTRQSLQNYCYVGRTETLISGLQLLKP